MRRRRHKRNTSTKLGLLFIIIIFSLASISASYAHWEEELQIEAEMTTIEFGSISGYVWLDDGDGVRGSCEVIGIKDYTVTLIDTFLNQQIVNITDDDGYYIFTGLLPVTYTIQITVTSPYTATTATSYIITLTVGEASTDNNFGLQDTTLMGWWKFDEGSGTTTVDSSTNGNHGAITGASWILGKVCNALDFDGTNDNVDIPSSSSLDITGDLTIQAWIEPDSVSYIAQGEIIGKWAAGDASYYFALKDGELQMRISSTGSDYYNYEETSNANLNINTWYHLAGVYDASAQDIKLYINGVEESTTVIGTIPSSIHSGSENVKIGGWWPGYYFDGIIDEVKIYNRVLTPNEISHIFDAEDI